MAQAPAARTRLEAILETVVDGVVTADERGHIELFNAAAEKIFGYQAAEVMGRSINVLMPEREASRHDGHIARYIETGTRHVIGIGRETVGRRKDGTVFPMELALSDAIVDGRRLFTAIVRDISERRRIEAELERHREQLESLVEARTEALEKVNRALERQARTDPLTRLANRGAFEESLDTELRRAPREQHPLTLLMCDVDHFKAYNDTYGHVRGDECLRAVARALSGVFNRAGDLTARYGGEEFAVVLPGIGSDAARGLAERARCAVWRLAIPHTGAPGVDRVTVSIGAITLGPDQRSEPLALIERADQALYQAKSEGRNRVALAAAPG
jgi:diguanylate cyclase (GGDEF)-like protein/PAS domain S-box-containing protein